MFFLKKIKTIRQSERSECGLACIAMILQHHDHHTTLPALRRKLPQSLAGNSIFDLIQLAKEVDLEGRAVRLTPDTIHLIITPAILHWDKTHFVVLERLTEDAALIHDPAKGPMKLALDDAFFARTSAAIELSLAESFRKRAPERSDIFMRLIKGNVGGWGRTIALLLGFALTMDMIGLLWPLYMKTVIDKILPSHDTSLLLVLAGAFSLVMVTTALMEIVRSRLVLKLGQLLSFRVTARVFAKMLRLPVSFFEKRHVGDVMSRMTVVEQIRRSLSEDIPAIFLDTVSVIIVGVFIFSISLPLALMVILFSLVETSMSVYFYARIQKLQEVQVAARAEEQSCTIESIQSIRAFRIFGTEAQREDTMLGTVANTLNANLGVSRTTITLSVLQRMLGSSRQILLVLVGAYIVVETGSMTAGGLVAFMAYAGSFSARAGSIIKKIGSFKMLQLHLERVKDIMDTDGDENIDLPKQVAAGTGVAIQVENASFSYEGARQPVFEQLSLSIEPGSFVAIIGPSGSGKTTLVKTILGLYPLAAGNISIDGKPVDGDGRAIVRGSASVVMQDDILLGGTVADNIAFYDEDPDPAQVTKAARDAMIYDEIMRMPMQFHTPVGQMGNVFSAGQLQRILIARALYRQPKLLLMDEGTANLDTETERAVAARLASLPCTKIMVTHRPALLCHADRIYECRNGVFREKDLAAGLESFMVGGQSAGKAS